MKNHCKHEEKICPGCGKHFECKLGDIANCQCQGIKFTTEATEFINKTYDDCLCRSCLIELNNVVEKEKNTNF